MFLNDLEIELGNETLGFKYTDDCTIIVPVYYDIDHSTGLIGNLRNDNGNGNYNATN